MRVPSPSLKVLAASILLAFAISTQAYAQLGPTRPGVTDQSWLALLRPDARPVGDIFLSAVLGHGPDGSTSLFNNPLGRRQALELIGPAPLRQAGFGESAAGAASVVTFDFVATSVVPEPISLVLLATGLLGIAAAAKLRRGGLGT